MWAKPTLTLSAFNWVGLKANLGQAMQNLANLFPSSKPTQYLNSIFKMWLVMKCIQVRLAELCSLSLFCEFEWYLLWAYLQNHFLWISILCEP